jgi:hypothetical protein
VDQVPRVFLNPRAEIPLAARVIILPGVMTAGSLGRALLLVLLAWWTWRLVPRALDADRIAGSFLHLVNLPFHEAGHILFSPFGEVMRILGGSLMQVIVPIACAAAFVRREDWFGVAVCLWWAGENLVDLGPYIADARALQLPLLGGQTGAEVTGHDWEAILGRLGWLHLDRTLGMDAHVSGSIVMVASLVCGVWILLNGSRLEAVDA